VDEGLIGLERQRVDPHRRGGKPQTVARNTVTASLFLDGDLQIVGGREVRNQIRPLSSAVVGYTHVGEIVARQRRVLGAQAKPGAGRRDEAGDVISWPFGAAAAEYQERGGPALARKEDERRLTNDRGKRQAVERRAVTVGDLDREMFAAGTRERHIESFRARH